MDIVVSILVDLATDVVTVDELLLQPSDGELLGGL